MRVLYAPIHHGGSRFLCRTCHGLSYRSRQEHKPRFAQLMDRLERLQTRLWRAPADAESLIEQARQLRTQFEDYTQRHRGRPNAKLRGRPGRPSKRQLRERVAQARAQHIAAQEARPKRPRAHPKTKRPYTRRQLLELSPPASDGEAFCVRCRDRRLLNDTLTVTLSNGRVARRGTCSTCGTRLCRLLSPRDVSSARPVF